MAYVSDRQHVEMLLLPMIAQNVVKVGVENPNQGEARIAIEHFADAMEESLVALSDKKKYSLIRRTMKLHEVILKPYKEAEARVDKMGLVLYNILNWSINCDYLVLHDGTAMSNGLALLLPALEEAANIAKLDESAKKAASKLLTTLQSEGYFHGVTQ